MGSRGDKLATIGGCRERGPLGPIVGAIDPLLRPTTTMLSHVQEHLRLKQRGSGPRSGPEMEMENPRVEIPTSKGLFPGVIPPESLVLFSV